LFPSLHDYPLFFGLSLVSSLLLGVYINLRDKNRLRRQTYKKIHDLFQV
ncbi:MAG: hypothetical protein HC913_19955, partial [Microscillaceae bacterium]|nr:hypothetical protein [Microscillaceae bacterium]